MGKPVRTKSYFAYWGKAGRDGCYHLLPYHSLDVAACGVTILRKLPRWKARLEQLTGLQGGKLERAIQVYFALHDLGKFATGFQNLRPDILKQLQGRSSNMGYSTRHDTLGYRLWQEDLAPWLIKEKLLPSTSRREPRPPEGVEAWMRAVTGHHGRPPEEKSQWKGSLKYAFDDKDREAARYFVKEVFNLTGLKTLPQPPKASLEATWWLAGLAVLADWLGSNRDFFPCQSNTMSLNDYWKWALKRAERAIDAAELRADPPAEHFTLANCFPEPPAGLQPTPLQEWAETYKIGAGPHLFILEDVTGSGKTEAAMILAQRLMKAGGGGGLYFGLPTMATANGMYQRLVPIYKRLFACGARPPLVLAHGRAELMVSFRATILPPPKPEADYLDGTEPAGAHCSAWLADSRKKALLAEVGVGTVDQALLAVLPARHQSLRMLGLLDKVLIVDEVHACDAYMNRLLAHLLRAHARAGGSAILLSATLPHSQRQELLNAFAEGAGIDAPVVSDQAAYPLATHLSAGNSAGNITQQPLRTRPEVARRVAVDFIASEDEAEKVLADAVSEGRCACWIRNTVDDARRSFESLKEKHPDWSLGLFHSRFALAVRLDIEKQVMAKFGKDSGPDQRRGQVLIATQVVEQSLDLDFDVMISDLAPIDLLIQRAGRLHRHRRDQSGARTDDADQRGIPKLTILAPPWDKAPGSDWLRAALPGTAAVYESEDAHLWRAMELLRDKKGWRMPDDARALIEGVYGANPSKDFPVGLRAKAQKASNLYRTKTSIAEYKVLDLEAGYRLQGSWLDEDSAPTRLGEPTTTVWLARLENDRLMPLHGGAGTAAAEAWMLSSLSLRRALAGHEAIPDGFSDKDWQRLKEALPGKGKRGVVIVLHQDGNRWKGSINNHNVIYSSRLGLVIMREDI